nr:hypothetical protein CFP56_41840 [Quercus suber]
MNDVVKNMQEELVKIDLNNGEGGEKLVKISKRFPEEERRKLITLLSEYKDFSLGIIKECRVQVRTWINLDVGLYRRLQRLGVFWLEMANDSKEKQRSCKTCSIVPPDQAEILNGEILEEDW